MSCAGTYYGVRDFVRDHGNDYFYPLMALAVERLDDDGQVVGTWHVDGVAPEVVGTLAFPNMRHFAMQQDGRYVLRFPDYGGPPGDVIVTVENMHTSDDGALLAVEYDGTRDAWVFTSTYQNTPLYSAPFPGSDDHYHLYEEVANLAVLHASEGGTYWQDHDADLVWVKLRGGLADFFVEDPREFSDETLYNPLYLRVYD